MTKRPLNVNVNTKWEQAIELTNRFQLSFKMMETLYNSFMSGINYIGYLKDIVKKKAMQ